MNQPLTQVVEYAGAHGLNPTAERFDLDRKTVRTWLAGPVADSGPQGLGPPVSRTAETAGAR